MKIVITLIALLVIGCIKPNPYDMCLKFYDRRGRLQSICNLSSYACVNLVEKRRKRNPRPFPRNNEEGCFYNK
jgi:hypothetical protein